MAPIRSPRWRISTAGSGATALTGNGGGGAGLGLAQRSQLGATVSCKRLRLMTGRQGTVAARRATSLSGVLGAEVLVPLLHDLGPGVEQV